MILMFYVVALMGSFFKGKIIVITGGSGGIGKGLVKHFCELEALVIFTYLNNQRAATDLLNEYQGYHVAGYKIDGRDHEQVKEFIEIIGTQHGHIDLLVNNAAIIHKDLLALTTINAWQDTIATNLNSVFSYSSTALKYLRRSSNGSIVNISSVVSDRPVRGVGAYASSKGGLETLTKVLAIEYGSFNVRVNSVYPSLVEGEVAQRVSSKLREQIIEKTPLKRIGLPSDVCNAVEFLASDKASFITGARLAVTGGRHIS